jgi:WD40 repeat protein
MCIDDNGNTKVWDLSEYKCVFTVNPGKGARGSACYMAKDDGSLVTGWRDGFIRSFDTSGRLNWEIS